LKSFDRILEAKNIIIFEKIGGDRIFSVIENIEEIRYAPVNIDIEGPLVQCL